MPVYALREPGPSIRDSLSGKSSIRNSLSVSGVRYMLVTGVMAYCLPVVRVEIAFHVLREGVIVGICQHDLTVQVDRGGNPVIFHTPSRNRIA